MKTFLINYELETTPYMEKSYTENKTILVEAEDDKKALETLRQYWKNKCSEYSVTYYVYDYEIIESIKQSEILK